MDESSALTYIKEVHEAKEFKFSSECLEILLKKNFMDAADYLLEQYYPKTQIDTEVIVRSVVSDIQRQQNYVLYRLLKAKNEKFRQFDDKVEEFPTRVVPMVYQAQSPDDLHFLVRLQEVFDDLDCNVTYEKKVEIKPTFAKVSAVCFESEDNVRLFERTLEFPQEIVPS